MVICPGKNIFVTASVFCALFLYTPLLAGKRLPVRNSACYSLLSPETVSTLEGTLLTNPVKGSSESYRATFSVREAESASGTRSSARGSITVIIPSTLAEAYYPGKTYTAALAQRAPIHSRQENPSTQKTCPAVLESGARLRLSGRTSSDSALFFVEEAHFTGWERAMPFCRVRAVSRLAFKRLMFSWGEAGGFVLALLSGAREYLSPSLSAAFTNAGLSHILALSGMHLTLLARFSGGVGKSLFSLRISLILQVLTELLFVWFAGISPSLFRALLCTLLTAFCAFMRIKKLHLFPILCTAFLIHTSIFPSHVYEPAFILSYSALSGIALIAPLVHRYAVRPPIPAASAVSESAGAQLCTAPASVLYFSRVAPFGIIAAVITGPCVGLFLSVSLAGIIISLSFPFLNPLVRGMIQGMYVLIKAIVLFFARFPAVTFR
ncbi:MAG: ComEC/Rec2 family competence protein [Treponema sp.]|nr:ComEC/Rec2 family competence protein [Treponema sp.]